MALAYLLTVLSFLFPGVSIDETLHALVVDRHGDLCWAVGAVAHQRGRRHTGPVSYTHLTLPTAPYV